MTGWVGLYPRHGGRQFILVKVVEFGKRIPDGTGG